MVKTLILSTSIMLGMASLNPVSAQKSKGPNSTPKAEVKFLDDISIELAPTTVSLVEKPVKPTATFAYSKTEAPASTIENASQLQLKFAILLDAEVEQITPSALYQSVDEWWGTRYQYGGSTRDGIDCSAFTQVVYNAHFAVSLPRTAKEQHDVSTAISREELKEGDLVFFNTRGGVSHVGVYLQNNKFAHAATSGGVMISDLDEIYWAKRFIGAGRYEKPAEEGLVSMKP
ncbi:lipoprotein Spr [Cnuella takakiae]|uniref:Lipoprotein Spr n=1 Tax=Cnuella takakiae TaxID=1302690 RepID=A0A1M5GH34_9BACT|nr:NlpC/P60 family protein [Cnuella takakiae]SHG03090.1 lipoprotein Spr [Cnuella takakiae]